MLDDLFLEWFASRQMLEIRSDSSARLGWPLEEGTKEGFFVGEFWCYLLLMFCLILALVLTVYIIFCELCFNESSKEINF